MSWNYRIVRHHRTAEWFGLHEVFFDAAGNPKGMSVDPVDFVSNGHDGPNGIIEAMGKALAIAQASPVLDEDDIPSIWAVNDDDSNPDVASYGT